MSKSSWSILIVGLVFLGLLGGGLVIFELKGGDEVVVEGQVDASEVDSEIKVPAPIVTGVKEEVEAEEAVVEEVAEEVESETEEVVAEEEEPAVPEVKKLTQDQEIALVEEYYDLLEDGKLEDAYAMKFEPKESFKKFEGWYGNVISTNPHDFTKTGDSRYQFSVELNEEGGVEGRYQVVMEIIEGKLLKTISSKETYSSSNLEEKVYNSELKAYVKAFGEDSQKIYLVRNGVEVLVDSMFDEEFVSMELLNFSSSGRYLIYRVIYGYEGNFLSVYDTITLKEVHEAFAASDYGFTKDEKYFYECQGTGMMAGYIEIFNVPSFSFKEDLTPGLSSGLMVGGCSNDAGSNLLKYTLFGNGSYDLIDHVYAF